MQCWCLSCSLYEAQQWCRKWLSCVEGIFIINELTRKHRECNRLHLLSWITRKPLINLSEINSGKLWLTKVLHNI